MLQRLALVVAVSILVGTPRMVVADPITYDFSGTFNQPFDGSTAFSGSLSFNATPAGDGQSVSDVSLTLNAGGQVFNFVNSPQDPSTSASVSLQLQPPVDPALGPGFLGSEPDIELMVGGAHTGATGSEPNITFGFTMYDYGLAAVPSNWANLSFSVSTASVVFPVDQGMSGGTLTSFEMVSTPEPSTLVIFGALGMAALVRRRCCGSQARCQQAREPLGPKAAV
jgi:hypothetical protein